MVYRRVEKALQHSYIGRKQKKRNHRSTWIQRINAATREYDMQYSQFIHGLNVTGIELNRKMLSLIAVNEPFSFKSIVDTVRSDSGVAPAKSYPRYGLLQSTVTNDSKPSNKRPLPKWNTAPIRSNLGFQPQMQ